MIEGFKHKGLEAFFLTGTCKGFRCSDRGRLLRVLEVIDSAVSPEDLFLPGLLLTKVDGCWAIPVGDNDHVAFAFRDGDVVGVDFVNGKKEK